MTTANRLQLIQTIFQRDDQLRLEFPWYREQVRRYIVAAIASDAKLDVTSQALLPRRLQAKANLVAKQPGVIAGLAEVSWAVQQFGVTVKVNCNDGQVIKAGTTLATLAGSIRSIMAVERTSLNVLQRLSGIATATRRCVMMIGSSYPAIAATRKTVLGALDKHAVALGGGLTHRLGLFDMGLVKDNHLTAIGGTSKLQKLFLSRRLFWEIEVDTMAQLKSCLQAELPIHALLLDNFTPETCARVITWARRAQYDKDIFFEASGGITIANLKRYAKSGVDVISLGALTHSTQALNLSLDIHETARA